MPKRTTQEIDIRVPPDRVHDDAFHRIEVAQALQIAPAQLPPIRLLRRSLDARRGTAIYSLRYEVLFGDAGQSTPPFELRLSDVSTREAAIIIGFGPAGMFAALRLIELGIKPIVLERGKAVRERRHDIAAIAKRGEVDPDSNYCFGEGGAGTFSDGKLYTRSTKRGTVERVLQIFALHGASSEILVEAHPHIGTNKLPKVVQAIREQITQHGGEVHFGSRVTALLRDSTGMRGVKLQDGRRIDARAVLLAAGHSSRDLFQLLADDNYLIEPKPFAVGVRVEHPQSLVDRLQYRTSTRDPELPPASYALKAQCGGRGVFSFCMCPGGIICPAATDPDEVVVNGWSPSKRNSVFANSGVVVEVKPEDLKPFAEHGTLAGLAFQSSLEKKAFVLGGGKQAAPGQRLTDFIAGRVSTALPNCSYLPGVNAADLSELFPAAFTERLRNAFKDFDKQRRGYLTDEAIVVAVESRTSSPVRVPRDAVSLMHVATPGMFPVGEGAGYAGGIVSAAMDGENAAEAVQKFYQSAPR